jgi:hypothetical protein
MVQMIYALSLIIGALIATMVVWSVFRTEKGLLVGVIWCGCVLTAVIVKRHHLRGAPSKVHFIDP